MLTAGTILETEFRLCMRTDGPGQCSLNVLAMSMRVQVVFPWAGIAMVQRVSTVAFEGIEARAVDVQVQVAPGMPAFNVVGLPDKAVSEARERVRSALMRTGSRLGQPRHGDHRGVIADPARQPFSRHPGAVAPAAEGAYR